MRPEVISPDYVGEDRFKVALVAVDQVYAFVPFEVSIAYGENASLPIEVVVHGPSPGSRQRTVYESARPTNILLTAKERGTHLVLVRELFHNRWQGRLEVDVLGDDLNTIER